MEIETLIANGAPFEDAPRLAAQINSYLQTFSKEQTWTKISKELLSPKYPFALHLYLFTFLFPEWPKVLDAAPAWHPEEEFIKTTNIAKFMVEVNLSSIEDFHRWTVHEYKQFWEMIITKLNIHFATKYQSICD
jgi:hypothetical protein